MTFRSLVLAVQFLTRLPTPQLADLRPAELSRSAVWFPLVGLLIGGAVTLAVWVGSSSGPWIGALAGLIAWVWITGALHLDGLADVADALGAAHREPGRFQEVLRDPHIGSFGVIALALQLLAKFSLLANLSAAPNIWALILVPAWARLGTLVWSYAVPPLHQGLGERFSWSIDRRAIAAHGFALAAASAWLSPALLGALVIIPGIALYWRQRHGGITGDGLGASVEVTETLLLVVLIVRW
jgi:adenosylcobinamide-GDP ribazoletransferase